MSRLFRDEALEHASKRLEGEVLLAVPLSSQAVGGIFAALVLGAALFASVATYARKENVSG